MIKIIKYNSKNRDEWDNFISYAHNGAFLFFRDYMDYHSDRFTDYSLMLYKDSTLVALLPANIVENTLHSHQGLTYGGIILSQKFHYSDILLYLNSINEHLNSNGVEHVVLKSSPYFYSNKLAQETDLILLRNKDVNTETILGASIYTTKFKFPKMSLSKKKLSLYSMEESTDYPTFWKILEINLKDRYDSSPVHTLSEIQLLADTFPINIKLILFRNKETQKVDAGAVLFINNNVIKTQYISSSKEGRLNRVSDSLYYSIINSYKDEYDFIDFGTCEEENNTINLSLLGAKEKFGANSFPIYKHKFSTSKVFIS